MGFGTGCRPEIKFELENRLPHASTWTDTISLFAYWVIQMDLLYAVPMGSENHDFIELISSTHSQN